ncbi:MAG: hypothetical protein C0169_00710 [Thermodesulfobacterium geofontis]|uniref:Uncharacterized protein n=1 Tax=Thermodesulfobacterium geofontis TaxID=1295609 RepID=A0A2N7QGK1_9BACT|nr:MAG: hypothetical protein C0169_00710 [Thermodesulfobacterium geofontis]
MKDERSEVVVPGGTPVVGKVKGLFQLLTEIQILSEGEKKSGDYNPEMVVPYTTRIAFSYEGIHTAFSSLILTFLTLPFIVGIFNHYFPAFGKYEHTTFEKFLIYSVAFSPAVVKVLFISFVLAGTYLGRSTKVIVDWFLWTFIVCLLSFGILGFFIYLAFYGYVLSEGNLAKIATLAIKNGGFWKPIFSVLYGIKQSLFKAGAYFLGYTVIDAFIAIASYFLALYKTTKRKKLLEKYDIRIESP